MLNDTELLALLRDAESDRVERKASAADMRKIRRAVCALANDLPGHALPGVIFVGVNDDGGCANATVNDELLKKLAQVRSGGEILPLPSVMVKKRMLDGCELAIIEVAPSSAPPVRSAGRTWVRVGPTTQQASAEDERILRERSAASRQPFDGQPAAGATLDDLDLVYFEREYLPSAIASDVLSRNQRSVEQRLASLRFLRDGVPTHGALMLFGLAPLAYIPGAYVQFMRIDGRELGDPIIDEKRIVGPLHEVIKQIEQLIDLTVRTRVDIASASKELRWPDYPPAALHQLIRNALIHRNYETSNAPVRVYWFNDRIEIDSPGGLFGQVTEATFGTGATDYRNPLMAEVMVTLGYVQRFGYGIPIARRLLKDNANPAPEFSFSANSVLVIVRRQL